LTERRADQKLAAILAADAAGYSRLMENDERVTVASLSASRDVFAERTSAHRGRIVDTAGDSVLAVFPSAIGAVEAAIDIQKELHARNEKLTEDQRMHFRIGVNLGDVIEKDDGSIYGSGVNVAARLEGLSEPGGITISEDVRRQVVGKLSQAFEDAGEHKVKNIAEPVNAYRVNLGVGVSRFSPPVAASEGERPAIAVLPFQNLSGDVEQEYFADGVAEDLITALSRLRWLKVTARNSTFTYKGQAVDLRRVGRDLNVRYVVEGSVRKGGDRVRITAQLIDASTGNHIWANRYDRDLSDIFSLQDEITETLVAALQAEVGEFERERANRKAPESLDAWECYQRGMWYLWRMGANDLSEAHELFQRASDLDPKFAQAVAGSALTLFLQVLYAYVGSPRENLEQALRLARNAVSLDEKETMGHLALGRVQNLLGEYEAAIAELRTAIELNPSSALAHHALAFAFVSTGRFDEGISECNAALSLSPRDPFAWGFYALRDQAYFRLGDYEAAMADAQRGMQYPAARFWPYATMAAALALLDRRDEAKAALDKLLQVKPDFTPTDAMAAFSPLDPERLRPMFQTWIDGLNKAGLKGREDPALAR
jgi:TolB-like protein/Tfp pilus assembly protein PilF